MMSIYEFNLASDHEKAMATWNGSFLADRHERDLVVQLYYVSDFYVELFYDVPNNEIIQFRSFKSHNLLSPYLDHINL